MRAVLTGMLVALVTAAPLAAQDPMPDPEAQALRRQIEERFAERVREELQLSDDQAGRLRETTREYAQKRRDLESRDRDLRRALQLQMRPGIAADQDSVTRLTDALAANRASYVRLEQEELGRLTFLTPVQRAQWLAMRERFWRRVRELRERRLEERMERRPGVRQRP